MGASQSSISPARKVPGRCRSMKRASSSAKVTLPALVEGEHIARKAAGVGFDWDNVDQVFDKMREELDELDAARKSGEQEAVEGEIGDLLFVVINIARFLKVDPEQALRKTNNKFRANLMPDADFSKIGEAFGAHGERVSNPDDIPAALARCVKEVRAGRTAILHARVTRL